VAGATGLVGQAVLADLLADKRYTKVHSIGRRQLPLVHPKLSQHTVDFKALPALPPINDVYIALGTTIKVAGSKAAFKAIDLDAVRAVALTAHAQGATKLGVVSAMGADANSPVFYSRIKGEMEEALSAIGYATVVFARPAMLSGDRAALQQPSRLGERLGLALSVALKPLIPQNYRSIRASDVAHGLIVAVTQAEAGVHIVLSGELQKPQY
jgi:uncharacterized protein YbjT (DUF2867 family)